MKGNTEIIRLLNRQLQNELTAVNQYFLHARMYKNWGFSSLGKHEYDESIEDYDPIEDVAPKPMKQDRSDDKHPVFSSSLNPKTRLY